MGMKISIPSNETKGVILPPAFPLLRQPGLGDTRHLSEIGLALRNMKLENECFKMHRFECMFDGLPLCIIEASGVTKWSPKWDVHPPYLGLWGSIRPPPGEICASLVFRPCQWRAAVFPLRLQTPLRHLLPEKLHCHVWLIILFSLS